MDVGVGGSRDGIFVTNVRKCAPSGEKESNEEKAASIDHCVRAYLQSELDEIAKAHASAGRRRATVQPIGADATRLMFGRGNMQKFHGSVFNRKEWEAMTQATESGPRDSEGEDDIPF